MRTFRFAIIAILMGVDICQSAPLVEDGDHQIQFADSLMLQQRFRESELEYERFAVERPHNPGRMTALQKMFDAAMATQDYTFTLKLARAWQNKLEGPDACLPFLYEGHALYELANYPAVLKQPWPDTCAPPLANTDRYLRGLSRLRLSQWPEARQEFEWISADSSLYPKAQEAKEKSLTGAMIPRKSMGLAAGLNAVLPGAGYAYANRPQTAAACLVVNGVFIWGTVASVHAKEPGLATLLSLFSFGWYWGGVYGAAQAAQKENQGRMNAFVGPLELFH